MVYKLKLIRGSSYTGVGVTATAKEPFVEVEDKRVVDYLVNECKRFGLLSEPGEFEAVEEDAADGETPSTPAASAVPEGEPGEHWTVPQLKAYATENGIDLGGAKAKTDILAKFAESAIDYSEDV